MHTVAVPRVVNENEAAAYLDVSPRTLADWRFRGVGPRFLKLGSAVRYRVSDLEAWMEERVRTSTSDTGGRA